MNFGCFSAMALKHPCFPIIIRPLKKNLSVKHADAKNGEQENSAYPA